MLLLLLIRLLEGDDSSLCVLDARKIGNDCTAESKFDIDEPEMNKFGYGK